MAATKKRVYKTNRRAKSSTITGPTLSTAPSFLFISMKMATLTLLKRYEKASRADTSLKTYSPTAFLLLLIRLATTGHKL
uniref:Uncharacterized protein n=1 Tax=Salmonella sp. TaxID=599 RepID=A0A482ETR6_SALSP|nr:hypothetical protein NNIBIDOC_00096 [Salmonella sp.]